MSGDTERSLNNGCCCCADVIGGGGCSRRDWIPTQRTLEVRETDAYTKITAAISCSKDFTFSASRRCFRESHCNREIIRNVLNVSTKLRELLT